LRYLESTSTDPAFNLALEQYAFDTLSHDDGFFMLWRNRDCVVVGLNQNTENEINREYLDANGIMVIRRLSGGGAVFHDLGNLNFTFITRTADNATGFEVSMRPVADALTGLGLAVELIGRNDMTLGGMKISGSAQYLRDGKLMHHGTLLFDTDLEKMNEALNVSGEKLASKGIKSVRARVTNIREHLREDMTMDDFITSMRNSIAAKMQVYTLNEHDLHAVVAIKRARYDTGEWNYGKSPDDLVKLIRL